MNYFDIKAKLDVILSKKKVVLTGLVMLLSAVMFGIQFLSTQFVVGDENADYLISFVWSVLGLIISNTIYFCILKHMRGEKFGMAEVRFSFKHLPIQAVMAIVYTLLRSLLNTLLAFTGMLIPFLYLILNLCLLILYMSVESTIAFCIYDGGINIAEITKGAFYFVKAKARIMLRCGWPYLFCNFAYIISMGVVLSGSIQTTGEMLDLNRTINFLASNPLSSAVLSLLGLTFVFWIIFAYFQLRIFSATAILYDENKPLFFSRMKTKK